MRALFLSLPLAGHVNPSLPLVSELARRGDDVVYYSTEAFADAIEKAQGGFRPYSNAFLADLSGLPEQLHELSWLLTRTTDEVLQNTLEAMRALRPDYVITDSVAPWGQWLGEILRIPVVTSVSTMAFNRHVLAFAARHGVQPKSARLIVGKARAVVKSILLARQLRRRYGVSGTGLMGSVCGRSDLNIVYTSRYFQPCADTFDERFEFVGPSIGERGASEAFPREWLRRDVHSVYVSLGTLFNTDASFYRKCFEALGGLDLQVVLSVGSGVRADGLGDVPANCLVRSHVPQVDVLQRVTAFVTHGGMNSVSESLLHGVPMVVIPQMSEQAMVGHRVEEIGAGVFIANDTLTSEELREAVLRVIREPSFRERAALVRTSFLEAGGVVRAADAIFAFTGR